MVRLQSCLRIFLPTFSACATFAAVINCRVSLGETTELALHKQIDVAIDGAHVGAIADGATDADFVRRVYLDLAGRSPSAEETRSFLDSNNPDKRRAAIDRLLASQEFNEFFASVLDIMFMERRAGKRVSQAEWQSFLEKAIKNHEPFDQIVRSILTADGTGENRGAAKFLLEREVEPNALTRDVGRIFLGRDLQCAQCHDHPVVGDYSQAEYYGLLAFLNRSYLFEDPADNKKAYVGEKADGITEYQSVFEPGDGPSRTLAALPGGLVLESEPRFDGEDPWLQAPSNKLAGIPRFSRRAELARFVTHPANEHFAENAVNRLWKHMMGKGIVDPVDFRHSDNPPSHPQLLRTLSSAFADMDFDIRRFLREIALSRTYQKAIDFPAEHELTLSQLQTLLDASNAAIRRLEADGRSGESARRRFAARLEAARAQLAEHDTNISEAAKRLTDLEQQEAKLDKAWQSTQKQLASKQSQADTLSAAARAAAGAVKAFPEDKKLADAHAVYKKRASQLEADCKTLKSSLADIDKQTKTVSSKIRTARDEVSREKTRRLGFADMVAEARGAISVFETQTRATEARIVEQHQRRAVIELCRDCVTKRTTVQTLQTSLAELESGYAVPKAKLEELASAIAIAQREIAAQEKHVGALLTASTAAEETRSQAADALESLKESSKHARQAAEQLEDPELSGLIESLDIQTESLAEYLAGHQQEFKSQSARLETGRQKLNALIARRGSLQAQHREVVKRNEKQHEEIKTARAELKAATAARNLALENLRESSVRRFAVKELRQLTPEQLAGATISALELPGRFRIEAENEWTKKHKKDAKKIRDSQKQTEIAALIRKRKQDVQSVYVSLFAAPAGAPQDVFSATADQALFLANDGRVQNWLRPAEATLLKRLQSIEDPDHRANELYLSVLSRPATTEEKRDVAAFLESRQNDTQKALQELAWGLLTSIEFRFNH